MEMSPASTMDVKRRNRANVLRCVLTCDRISQVELTQRLALSWPTVLQNVKELTAAGLLHEVGTYESTGGRKAKAYAAVRDAKLAIGLDVTQDHVSIVLVNLSGQVVHCRRNNRGCSFDSAYMQGLGEAVQELVDEYAAGDRILGVGISLPGIVSEKAERLYDSHILGVHDISTHVFSQYLPYACHYINDANAAALAEVYNTSAPEDMVYLSLSDSVGGAIINAGTLYTGTRLRAGEFGHTTLIPGGRRCYCGKNGCLDAYCSAKVLSDHTNGNLPQFFDRLRAHETSFLRTWHQYLDFLSIAINNLNMSFDCDVMVGGYVGAYLEEFGYALRQRLEQRNTFGPNSSYLKFCRYKQEASAVGAALLWINQFIQGADIM